MKLSFNDPIRPCWEKTHSNSFDSDEEKYLYFRQWLNEIEKNSLKFNSNDHLRSCWEKTQHNSFDSDEEKYLYFRQWLNEMEKNSLKLNSNDHLRSCWEKTQRNSFDSDEEKYLYFRQCFNDMKKNSIQCYEERCLCKEEFSILKKPKRENKTGPRFLEYPIIEKDKDLPKIKTFQIKYEKNLSAIEKTILNTFQNKYIYYAIDDILNLLPANSNESENLLALLYSAILSLQNNFLVNFFDIWIQEIYIEEISKKNKFLRQDFQISTSQNYITLKLCYKPPGLIKKTESLW